MGKMRWRQGSATIQSSSAQLGWRGLVVEEYSIDPGEKPESVTDQYIVELNTGHAAISGERSGRRGHMMRFFKPQGTFNIYSDGVLSFVRPTVNESELTVVALEQSLVRDVAEETKQASRRISGRLGISDRSISSLIRLLAAEARSGGPSGALYVDHLKHALTLKLLSLDQDRETTPAPRHTLSESALRRVLGMMEADLAKNLSLDSLARESGYSRTHFLRLFRATTGETPHQYLLRLRINHAQSMILHRRGNLVDIALASGFSAHAHFSRVFRQVLGRSPSEFRTSLK